MQCDDPALLDDLIGDPTADERARVVEHLSSCARCGELHRGALEALTAMATMLPTLAPSARTRDAILREANGRSRFSPFTARVARMFDVDEARAFEQLQAITGDEPWIAGASPGVRIAPVLEGGSAVEGASLSFLEVRRGVTFPEHSHLGLETLLILSGSYRDLADGSIALAGDVVTRVAGSQHAFTVLDAPGADDCVCACVLRGGIVLLEFE